MNIIKKMIMYIKNKLIKHEDIKRLELPKQLEEIQKKEFIKSIKILNNKKEETEENEDVETLICVGDGLGIQKRLKST